MVMMPGPLVEAVEAVRGDDSATPVILLTPQGRVFNQRVAEELAGHPRLILVCGRYEGVDERVRKLAITDEISIGDFVLTGGELAAMVIVDAVSRLVPGVLGARWAAEEDSHAMGLLEYPALHAPARFPRDRRAGDPAERRSRRGRRVAPPRGDPPHVAAAPRPAADRRSQRRGGLVPGGPGRERRGAVRLRRGAHLWLDVGGCILYNS